ncbi:MAG: hypothetical protein L0170_06030, partial [Acidobacteria bacterium]|nr:hypothetical protein [Acidobacteriota bacterium]
RTLGVPLNGIQQALRRLEVDGLVAGRLVGRMRLYPLNPRYFARQELTDYLKRLAEPETELTKRIEGLRKRPRRAGKRIDTPARTEFRALAAKARAQAHRAGLKPTDVQKAIRKVRRHG